MSKHIMSTPLTYIQYIKQYINYLQLHYLGNNILPDIYPKYLHSIPMLTLRTNLYHNTYNNTSKYYIIHNKSIHVLGQLHYLGNKKYHFIQFDNYISIYRCSFTWSNTNHTKANTLAYQNILYNINNSCYPRKTNVKNRVKQVQTKGGSIRGTTPVLPLPYYTITIYR